MEYREAGMPKTIKEVIVAVASSNPKIEVESVHPDGDVVFIMKLKDLGLLKTDLENQFMRTRFLVNFLGEFVVRDNLAIFATILTGLPPTEYEKIITNSRHTDFGMVFDRLGGIIKFQMHISLVEQIMTEDVGRILINASGDDEDSDDGEED
jgi:hypothetical protein